MSDSTNLRKQTRFASMRGRLMVVIDARIVTSRSLCGAKKAPRTSWRVADPIVFSFSTLRYIQAMVASKLESKLQFPKVSLLSEVSNLVIQQVKTWD